MKKIKGLVIPPLLFLIALPTAVEANWFGKYGSYREAKEACNVWSIRGGKAYFESIGRTGVRDLETDIRKCVKEEETNQLLGLEKINIKSLNYTWKEWGEIDNPYYEKVRKRFKY